MFEVNTGALIPLAFIPAHIFFWMILKDYPDELLVIIIVICLSFFVIKVAMIRSPKIGRFLYVAVLGLMPGFVAVQFQEYAVFFMLLYVISLLGMIMDQEYGWEVIVLTCFHLIGYISASTYYLSRAEESKGSQLQKILTVPGALWQTALVISIGHWFAIVCSLQKAAEKQKQTEYEEKLVLLNQQLESSNKQLQESNNKLEHALMERENFILRFSHEIRNPLNCVLGNLELSLDTTTDLSTREMLQEAIVCGEILLQLLNNVLDTGKVATGRLEVSRKPHNIREFLERMWIVSSEIIHKKGLTGRLYMDKRVPNCVEFDDHRMMQIIINLVSNAAKFTKSGYVKSYFDFEEVEELSDEVMLPKYQRLQDFQDEVTGEEFYTCYSARGETATELQDQLTVTNKKFSSTVISAQNQSRPSFGPRKGYIRIEIADTGCGIKREALSTLFKRFGQVHDDDSMRQVGTGLGLWITKELVEIMQGKIKAYSVPNIGTVFVIMIKSESHPPLSSPYQSMTSRKESVSFSKRLIIHKPRVLVVDDASYNREINCKFFNKAGITELEVAENGLKALEAFIVKGPNYFTMISMDIDMPIMTGKEAIKQIREYEREKGWTPVQIIIITAYAEAKTKSKLLDPKGIYRANLFLSKPTSFNVIKKAIEDLLRSVELPPDLLLTQTESITKQENKKELVLIVDDDKFNQLTLMKMFRHVGVECIVASSGEEAIIEFKKQGVNLSLVVTDCGMKPVDGFEAASEMRAIMRGQMWSGLRKVPIIGISGNQGAEFEKRCIESGMVRFFTKPISLSTVQEIMLNFVRLRSLV